MKLPIYLDYMATTPIDPQVVAEMMPYLTEHFGNAASPHGYGVKPAEAIDGARAEVAALIRADVREIIWTSGATESNNLALKGAARFYSRKGKHVVTLKTEHKAVLDPLAQLQREGFEVSYLSPKNDGLVDLAELEAALRPDTILVSIMHANNEIGVIQDLNAIAALTRPRGILFHVDAAQSAGKIPLDVRECKVDLLSLSAHKIYGPKGVGALYVRQQPRVRLEALIHGGGQEQGLRAGTLATHQIVGMGVAFRIAKQQLLHEGARILQLRTKLWQGIANIPGIQLNGAWQPRVPGNLNVSFAGIEGESLILSLRDLAISTASACTSASIEPSYVLRALKIPDNLAHSAARISIGRYTTDAEIDFAIMTINQQVERLRTLTPS